MRLAFGSGSCYAKAAEGPAQEVTVDRAAFLFTSKSWCLARLAKKLAGLCLHVMGWSPGAAEGPPRPAEPQHRKPGDTIGLEWMEKPQITRKLNEMPTTPK